MEQALTFASIILGVAVALELTNLHHLLRCRKVRWHWAQPIFAAFVLMLVMFFWWSMAKNTTGSISLGRFLPVMFSMVMLVLLSAVALPDKFDDQIDLAQYYQDNRRYMWGLLLCAALPLNGQWIFHTAQESASVGEFLNRTATDLMAMMLIGGMMFVRRWWLVATGFAVLSIGPVAWLSRTI